MSSDRSPLTSRGRSPAMGYGAAPYAPAVSPVGGPYPQGSPQHYGQRTNLGFQGQVPSLPVGLPLGGTSPMGTAPPITSLKSPSHVPMSPDSHIGPYPPGVEPAAVSPPGVDSPTYSGPLSPDPRYDGPNPANNPIPMAPPIEKMDHFQGYNNVTFEPAYLPPPPYEAVTSEPPVERRPLTNVPVISEDQAREALLEYVGNNCCYGKNAAREMIFRGLESTSAFHYTLETFTESRQTLWKYEPYRGEPLDTILNGPVPGPWEVSVPYPEKFKNGDHKVEVPHTASVKPCHTCSGHGKTRCSRCYGRGQVTCDSCSGTGSTRHFESPSHSAGGGGSGGGSHFGDFGDDYGDSPHHHSHRHHHHHHHHMEHHQEPCSWCEGTGRKRCTSCHGFGEVSCKTCHEAANLKCYIELTVTWKNHYEDFIVERTALPDKLIRGVSGQTAFEEENTRTWPINHFPDQTINQASNRLVHKHSTEFPNERILCQRQRVRIVPVTEATYEWKTKTSQFFVYGFEHKVYAPDYPQKFCWGCTLL